MIYIILLCKYFYINLVFVSGISSGLSLMRLVTPMVMPAKLYTRASRSPGKWPSYMYMMKTQEMPIVCSIINALNIFNIFRFTLTCPKTIMSYHVKWGPLRGNMSMDVSIGRKMSYVWSIKNWPAGSDTPRYQLCHHNHIFELLKCAVFSWDPALWSEITWTVGNLSYQLGLMLGFCWHIKL